MRLEPKPAPSLAVTILFPLAAIAATLALTSILVLAAGASPLSVFYLVAKGAASMSARFPMCTACCSKRASGGRRSC